MNESPVVSIILCTYNGEKYLVKQLESLFHQTYTNIEIIAVDDGSSDKTVEILKEHAARHPNMKVFVNEENVGFVKNFNKGCSLSTGPFLALCDQDDYWEPDKIKKLINTIGEHSMIYSDSYLCNQSLEKTGKKISDIVNCLPFYNCLEQAIFCRIYGHATLFTRALYNHANPFLSVIPHDWWLCYMATLQNGITYLPEPLVYYRQHSENLIGAVGGKRKKNKSEKRKSEKAKIRSRINAFYIACPESRRREKKVLLKLTECYRNFSLINNIKRVIVFLQYRHLFLKVKKHSELHRFLFCLKMFVKIK